MNTASRRAGLVPRLLRSVGVSALLATPAIAQQSVEPIQDNSFLVEEAYNQPAGVVQHINTFSRPTVGTGWAYSFTQEWPVGSVRHQLSYTVPVISTFEVGLGDVALNYRYQLTGATGGRVKFAPRVSLVAASGDARKGFGAGGPGVQGNLPLSVEVDPRLTLHANAGVAFTPRARDLADNTAATASYTLAGSAIWFATPHLNGMLEAVWGSTERVVGAATTARAQSLYLAPGVRRAFDLASGLQVVPGVAYVIGVGPSTGSNSFFLYLSLEHPFTR